MRPTRRLAVSLLVLFALTAAACGDDDDDGTVSSDNGDTTSETAADDGDDDGEPAGDDGAAALEFFLSTEPTCAAHATETGNPVIDPSLFADATYDAALSEELGGSVIVDGAGNRLLVDLDEEIVTSTDGPSAALPQEYSFGCPEDLYVGTIDDGGAAGDACTPWDAWRQTGDAANLDELAAAVETDPAASAELLDAIEYLRGDPPTETADDQQQYEAAVDIITAELADGYGCTP